MTICEPNTEQWLVIDDLQVNKVYWHRLIGRPVRIVETGTIEQYMNARIYFHRINGICMYDENIAQKSAAIFIYYNPVTGKMDYEFAFDYDLQKDEYD
jgi:hypothetical protein